MSLCRLMIDDFENNTGYRIADMRGRPRKYSRHDLLEGIDYAYWLISEGYKIEPFLNYNLLEFIEWAKIKLTLKTFKYR